MIEADNEVDYRAQQEAEAEGQAQMEAEAEGKFKTLKTLDCYHINNKKFGSFEKEHGICIEDLKINAIKWIKQWKSYLSRGVWIEIENHNLVYDKDKIKENADYTRIGSISTLTHFFNITEKDLK